MQLRDYQLKAQEDSRTAFREGHRAVCLIAPTGAGKTAIASSTIQLATQKGNRCLFLAHRQELLDQINATLDKFPMDRSLVQVESIQTMVRRLERTQEPDLIVADEASHSISDSWLKVLNHWPKSKVWGLTATPQRLDGRGLGDVFQKLVYGPSVQSLIDRGFLCRPVYYAPKTDLDLSNVSVKMGDYAKDELESAVTQSGIVGSATEHYARICPGVPAIAFCISREHGKSVAEQFRNAGWTSETLFGDMPREARHDLVKRFTAGSVNVLVTVDIATEGFDAPGTVAAILLRPTQSLALHLQTIGRVLRTYPVKDRAVILDHVGNLTRPGLGLAEWDREWTLEGKKRSTRTADELPDIAIKRCPSCFAIAAGGTVECPECGTCMVDARPSREKAGMLEEVETRVCPRCGSPTINGVRCGGCAKDAKEEERACKTKSDFIALAKSRGYENPHRWAFVKMQIRSKFKRYAHPI